MSQINEFSARPRDQWIAQQRQLFQITKDGPAREAIGKEIEESIQIQNTIDGYRAPYLALGFQITKFPGKCAVTGAVVEASKGWTRKESGRWITYSATAARDIIDKLQSR